MFNFSSSVLLAWCLSSLIVVDIDCKFYSNMYNFPTDINKPEYLLKNNNKDVNLPVLTTDSQTMINITQLSSNFMHELISNNQVQIVYNSYNELDINVMKTNISNIHNNITIILDISHNILKSNVIHIINQIIKKLNKLQVLILDYNQLHYHDVRNLISILRRHSSIQQLSLSSCSLTDECMGCIAYLLKMNSNITSLDLSNNRITEIGFSEILYVLQHHSSNLTYLDLSYNKIGNHGISLLINLLENNKLPQLKYLLLKDVGIDRECVEKLLSVLNLRALCYHNAMGVNNVNVSTPHIDSASNVSDFTDDALKKSKVIIAKGSLRSKMVKKRKGRRSNNSSSSYNSKKGSRDNKGLDNVNKAITVSSRLMVLDISGNLLFVRKTNRKKIKKLPDFLTMPSLPTLFTSILNNYGSSSSSNGVTSSDDDDDVNANANVNDEGRDAYNAIDETISTTATNIRYGRSCHMKTIKSNRSLKIQKKRKNKSGTSEKKKMKFITKYTRKTVAHNANAKKDKHMENRKYLKKKKIMKINQSQVSSVYNSLNKSILEQMMMMMMMPGTVNSGDSSQSFYLGLVETGLNDVWCIELIEMIEKEKKIRKLGQNRNGNNGSSSSSCTNIDDDDADDDDSAKVFKTGLSFNIIGNDISAELLTKLLQL